MTSNFKIYNIIEPELFKVLMNSCSQQQLAESTTTATPQMPDLYGLSSIQPGITSIPSSSNQTGSGIEPPPSNIPSDPDLNKTNPSDLNKTNVDDILHYFPTKAKEKASRLLYYLIQNNMKWSSTGQLEGGGETNGNVIDLVLFAISNHPRKLLPVGLQNFIQYLKNLHPHNTLFASHFSELLTSATVSSSNVQPSSLHWITFENYVSE
jgi:hypothetical protein